MEINGKLLILDESDIQHGADKKEYISITDLKSKSYKQTLVSSMVVLNLKESNRTIVIKNRWGCDGIVVPQGSYDEFMNWLENKPAEVIKSKKIPFWKKIFPFNK